MVARFGVPSGGADLRGKVGPRAHRRANFACELAMGKARHRTRRGASRAGYSRRRGKVPPCCCPLGVFSLPATGIGLAALVFLAYRLISESGRSRAIANSIAPILAPVSIALQVPGNSTAGAALGAVPVAAPGAAPVSAPGAAAVAGPPPVPALEAGAVADAPPAPVSAPAAVGSPIPAASLVALPAAVAQQPVSVPHPVRAIEGIENKAANGTTNRGEDLGEYDTSSTTRAGLPTGNANHSSVEVRKGNDVLRIPRGSRITGALPEFSGVVTANGSIVRGQNVTRVSYALYKIVKLFGFTSMVDSPAGAHIEWMSQTLQRIEFDRPSFKYWGIDENLTNLRAAREAIGAAARSEYRRTDVTENPPAGVDVLFHWTELDGTKKDPRSKDYPDHIESVLRSAKRTNATYIIFGQFPRLRGFAPAYRHGKWLFVGDGSSTKPFLYNDYVRGVVPVMPSANPYVLYMTFYSVRSLPL